jgi:hypothetical protein
MGGKQSKPVMNSSDTNSMPVSNIKSTSLIPVSDNNTQRDDAMSSLQSTRESITKYKQLQFDTITKLKEDQNNKQLQGNLKSSIVILRQLEEKKTALEKIISSYKGGRKVKKYTQYRKRRPQRRTRKYKQNFKKLFK